MNNKKPIKEEYINYAEKNDYLIILIDFSIIMVFAYSLFLYIIS